MDMLTAVGRLERAQLGRSGGCLRGVRTRFLNGLWTGLLSIFVGVLPGCGDDFEPRSVVNSLRLLGVQADKPLPRAGDTVSMKLLWHDGASPPDEPRAVQSLWLAGCFNPKGDLYYECFEQLAKRFRDMGTSPRPDLDGFVGTGDTFTLKIPEDLISARPQAMGREPYGLSYVFVALCAGKLSLAQGFSGPSGNDAQTGADGASSVLQSPLECQDERGTPLTSRDFVFSYFRMYSYEDHTNQNPVLVGLEIDGVLVDETQPPAFPVCPEKGGDKCPVRKLRVVVDPVSVEVDTRSSGKDGATLQEQIWVEYLATGGKIESPLRLINDAVAGFNDDNGTDFKAPSTPGKHYIFAVVRDNRGGQAWIKQPLVFE